MTPVFFTDRDLGKRFPEILSAAGLQVERHADHFAPDASDEEWLALVGSRGWVAVSHDRRIRYKPYELGAVLRHNDRDRFTQTPGPSADQRLEETDALRPVW